MSGIETETERYRKQFLETLTGDQPREEDSLEADMNAYIAKALSKDLGLEPALSRLKEIEGRAAMLRFRNYLDTRGVQPDPSAPIRALAAGATPARAPEDSLGDRLARDYANGKIEAESSGNSKSAGARADHGAKVASRRAEVAATAPPRAQPAASYLPDESRAARGLEIQRQPERER